MSIIQNFDQGLRFLDLGNEVLENADLEREDLENAKEAPGAKCLDRNLGKNLGMNLGRNFGNNLGNSLGMNLAIDLGKNLGRNLGINLAIDLGKNLGRNFGKLIKLTFFVPFTKNGKFKLTKCGLSPKGFCILRSVTRIMVKTYNCSCNRNMYLW